MSDEFKPVNDGETQNQSTDAAEQTAAELTDSQAPAEPESLPETDAAEEDTPAQDDHAAAEASVEAALAEDALRNDDAAQDADADELPDDDEDLHFDASDLFDDPEEPADEPAEQSSEPGGAVAAALAAAGSGMNRLSSEPAKKKSANKKIAKPRRTIEQEIKQLEEEEKHFDSWGRPIRKKKKKRKKSSKLSCTLVLLTLILAISSVLSVAILAIAKEMYGIDKDVQKRVIIIPEGASTAQIAAQLQDEKLITMPKLFRLVSRMNQKDGQYIAGQHELSASMSYEAMIDELCHNYKNERKFQRVVIPEGTNLREAAKILQENEICKADDFLFYFNAGGYGYRFEQYLPQDNTNSLKFDKMEGYCFPDTYEFYVGEDPSIVAQKIYANFDSKLTDGDYKKMEEWGMTLDEVITLASIVQAEAPFSETMRKVSSVFHNRMNNKAVFSKLQSDPTKKYAKEVIAPNQVIKNELMLTAYNTYEGQGLPPGAINSPGLEAIQATLYPDDTPYYFFNANINTRQVYYAITYDDHLKNLAKVQQEYAEEEAAENGEGPNNDE